MGTAGDEMFEKLFRGNKETKYDRDEFYTRATNRHDHARNIQTGFPDTIYAEIHAMVRRGAFPKLTSPQALIRDAVVHSLHYLAEKEGNYEAAQALNVFRVLARQEEWKLHRAEMREMLSNLEANLNEAIQDQDWDEVDVLCDDAQMDMGDLPKLYQSKLEAIVNRARAKVDKERGGMDW